ncbi:hypothetical protein BURMUCF1_B0516 [Burkholderia multivorans ATCC BAA-247]|nr:hypothetical protein BURMUCF1_B0516 [Burkholderia multivorans ATCC BAA-247]
MRKIARILPPISRSLSGAMNGRRETRVDARLFRCVRILFVPSRIAAEKHESA